MNEKWKLFLLLVTTPIQCNTKPIDNAMITRTFHTLDMYNLILKTKRKLLPAIAAYIFVVIEQ